MINLDDFSYKPMDFIPYRNDSIKKHNESLKKIEDVEKDWSKIKQSPKATDKIN
jgi:hypothetical protein